jgi:hypothetical protein
VAGVDEDDDQAYRVAPVARAKTSPQTTHSSPLNSMSDSSGRAYPSATVKADGLVLREFVNIELTR